MTPERFLDERYRDLLDTAPDAMVVVDHDGIIRFVNAQTERIFGYERAELLGKTLETIIPRRFHHSHSGHVARYFKSPSIRAMGSGLELFGARKDGSELPIEVSLSPVGGGDDMYVSAAIRDITERKRMQAAAKLNADRLASAMESIQDAFALFDAKDDLAICNSAYRRLVGEVIPGRLIGRSYADLLREWSTFFAFGDESQRTALLDAMLSERHESKEPLDVKTKDGRSLRITDRRTPEGGVVQTIWDVTDDMRRAEELRVARIAAEQGSDAKSEFLSSMSHELRTPLNAILGFAQLLQRDKKEPLSARHTERVDQILKGGEHLLRLIDDILDLSRIEAGRVTISTEPVDVLSVIHEVKATLEPSASRSGIRVDVVAPASPVPAVSVDRTRFAQILMNYGSNAIKYNRPSGKVAFVLSMSSSSMVRVAVEDTGFGIPLDQQDKIFHPFQRAGQETGPIEGTGIGLTITKRLAELMEGQVGFHSVPTEGSSFWVDVPIHAVSEEVQPPAPQNDFGPLSRDSKGLILYIEDNPANVAFMQALVDNFEEIELNVAPTAEMGIELARQRSPRVIIMDINLPGMSGLDALRALKAMPETQHIPVIALTAAASERDRQRGEQAGFHRYLTKPVKVAELEGVLETLFR